MLYFVASLAIWIGVVKLQVGGPGQKVEGGSTVNHNIAAIAGS